jgi:dTDP-4-dehydrorhamnose 3,5-epimerase-like enzyme
MDTFATRSGRLRHQEHDRISIPEDVPALGVEKGNEGVVRGLHLHNETVFAFVMVTYSTGQSRGWVIVELKPQKKVRSYMGPAASVAAARDQLISR